MPAADEDKRSKVDRSRHRTTVVLAIIGLVLAAIPIYLALQPDSPEEFLAKCQSDHPSVMSPLAERSGNSRESRRFVGCSWPPVVGASTDGFYEIELTEYQIPDSIGGDKFTLVQAFRSACKALTLRYKFANQQTAYQEMPITVYADQVISMYDATAERIPSDLWPVIGDEERRLFVLSHFRYDLSRIECVNPK